MTVQECLREDQASRLETRQQAMIDYLRAMVLDGSGVRERFHAIFLDGQRAYLGDTPLGLGRTHSLSVRMRDLFARALALGASGIIIAHNHPSGDCRPSPHDIEATRRLVDVAQALDIQILDHIIITQGAVYSMRAGGSL